MSNSMHRAGCCCGGTPCEWCSGVTPKSVQLTIANTIGCENCITWWAIGYGDMAVKWRGGAAGALDINGVFDLPQYTAYNPCSYWYQVDDDSVVLDGWTTLANCIADAAPNLEWTTLRRHYWVWATRWGWQVSVLLNIRNETYGTINLVGFFGDENLGSYPYDCTDGRDPLANENTCAGDDCHEEGTATIVPA